MIISLNSLQQTFDLLSHLWPKWKPAQSQRTQCQRSRSEGRQSQLNRCCSSWRSLNLLSEHSASSGSQRKAKEDQGERTAILRSFILLWESARRAENSWLGKTRGLFKKITDAKGTFHAKMGTMKDRNGMDLIKEDIKKRWQEYTTELYKKDLHDWDKHNGVISHLEPDILECEVKWAWGSITMNEASGGDGIPVELLQILKDDAVKVLHSVCQQMWKTQQWPQDWKRSVFIPIPKKGNLKECSNYAQLHSSHTLAK